jgi:hypothetical protein
MSIYGTGFSPLVGEPRMGMIPIPTRTATLDTLTTAGGARTATAAEVLGGLFILNVDDAQTLTLPTGALLNAAIPGASVGASFDFDVINTGDATLTVAVGTGGTLATGSNSKSSVATVASAAAKRFTVVITGVASQNGTGTDGYTVYGHGDVGTAVA